MPAIDIDRDSAHGAAQHELAKPIYPKDSLLQQFIDWLARHLGRLLLHSTKVPGGWFTVAVVLILLAVATLLVVRIARNTLRTRRGSDGALFGPTELSAAEHRATAERYAIGGEWAAAIRHRLRAVARQLEESAVLSPVPGRTANELAHDSGTALPNLAVEFSSAATIFNDVTYGSEPGTESGYRLIADLDDHLRSGSTAGQSSTADQPATTWASLT